MANLVTIKNKKVKKGMTGEREWVNTIFDDTAGGRWTSFELGLSFLNDGDQIKIIEYEEGSGNQRNKITKYEKVESVALSNGNGKEPQTYKRDVDAIKYEYQLKARLQEIDRVSIEAQTAYKGIVDIVCSIFSMPDGELPDDLFNAYQKAIQWAETRLDAKPTLQQVTKPQPEAIPKVTNGKGEEVNPEAPFPHIGALLNYCAEKGISKAKALELWQAKEEDLPKVDVKEAYQKIKDYLGKPDPERLFD